MRYRFLVGVHGDDGLVEDRGNVLPEHIDPTAPWPIDLWFGAWDSDGLVAFVQGELRLPLAS